MKLSSFFADEILHKENIRLTYKSNLYEVSMLWSRAMTYVTHLEFYNAAHVLDTYPVIQQTTFIAKQLLLP